MVRKGVVAWFTPVSGWDSIELKKTCGITYPDHTCISKIKSVSYYVVYVMFYVYYYFRIVCFYYNLLYYWKGTHSTVYVTEYIPF